VHELSYLHLSAAALAFAALVGVEARSAEIEGALQYPPPSVGEDAQPPPPARTVPELVSPSRVELGVTAQPSARPRLCGDASSPKDPVIA
jgi:hypothetical protein